MQKKGSVCSEEGQRPLSWLRICAGRCLFAADILGLVLGSRSEFIWSLQQAPPTASSSAPLLLQVWGL